MAITATRQSTRLISVHNQPAAIRLEVGGLVTPGTYTIPPVSAPESEFKKCIFTFPNREPIQYAHLRELDGEKFVEIEVFEGTTPQFGNEFVKGLTDDYGKPMSPPLSRALLTVTSAQVANELERQAKFFEVNMGIIALDHEPTKEDIQLAKKNNLDFMRWNIAIANKETKLGRAPSYTQLAHAWTLHKLGLLNPLPDWASVNPEGGAAVDTQNCVNCGAILSKRVSKCPHCSTILDWKLAVERGQVIPRDVPKSKRVEAGLEQDEIIRERPELNKSAMKAEVQRKVQESFAARDEQTT